MERHVHEASTATDPTVTNLYKRDLLADLIDAIKPDGT